MAIFFNTTKQDVAFVRTGLGGTNIFKEGVCITIPGFHNLYEVNLKAFPVHISRIQKNSLKAKDVFVDVEVIFQVVINSDNESILKASSRFGDQTFKLSQNELITSQLAGALRDVSATMTIEELQSQRAKFQEEIKKSANNHFEPLGLCVQSVSIESLRQTNSDLLDANDMFGAQAKAFTAKEVQKRKKEENDSIKENEIAIECKNVEIQKQKYSLEVDKENARIEAEKQKTEYERDRAIAISEAQAMQEQRTQEAIINAAIQIEKKEAEKFTQKAKTSKQLQEANEAETAAETVKLKAIAERDKEIGIIEAQREIESQKVKIIQKAEAEKQALNIQSQADVLKAENEKKKKLIEAEANLEFAKKEAEAIKIIAEAKQKNYEVEAEGKKIMLDAENSLSEEARNYNLKMETIKQAPKIIEAMYKPMEKVNNFSIIQANGIIGGPGTGSISNNSDNLPNQMVDAMNKNRIITPLAEKMLETIGIDTKNISSVGNDVFDSVINNKKK